MLIHEKNRENMMYFGVWSGLEQDLVVPDQQDLVVPEQQDLVVPEQQNLVVD